MLSNNKVEKNADIGVKKKKKKPDVVDNKKPRSQSATTELEMSTRSSQSARKLAKSIAANAAKKTVGKAEQQATPLKGMMMIGNDEVDGEEYYHGLIPRIDAELLLLKQVAQSLLSIFCNTLLYRMSVCMVSGGLSGSEV